MKNLFFSLVAVIIICACAATTQQYRLETHHYEDLKYGFSLDLPDTELWKIDTKWPEIKEIPFPKALKDYRHNFRLSMINESQVGIIHVWAISSGDIIPKTVDICDRLKAEMLESNEKNVFEEKPWNVDDFLKGNDCLLKFGIVENDTKLMGLYYIKTYREDDNVIFLMYLVSIYIKYGSNYLTFKDLVKSLSFQ